MALLITDFTAGCDPGWFVVNDNVMGGRSQGDFRIDQRGLVFSGITNTNGGGFSSIRTQPRLPSLVACTAITVHARGDGRRYVLRVESGDGTAYWADFDPPEDGLSPCRVPLATFRPRFRGRWLAGPALSASTIVALGFMCYDGRDGPFSLRVERIEAD